MKIRVTEVVLVLACACGDAGSAIAATPCVAGSKIFTHCDEHQDSCVLSPMGSLQNNMCEASATANAYYACQRYRVPCGFKGTYFDLFGLARYPTVGAPFVAPHDRPAPDDTRSILESIIPAR